MSKCDKISKLISLEKPILKRGYDKKDDKKSPELKKKVKQDNIINIVDKNSDWFKY